ncbi:testis-specific Y-encoded-like protein 6 [Cebus imitator]|uniref:testis-specific Y-encoded-like protein 6 n=1 Tax=Cebus imitator TaxID=2715852 RepID=UPI000809F7BE|nr:testis-specific Y-encoded-like protein 6 [Cebus imitator]
MSFLESPGSPRTLDHVAEDPHQGQRSGDESEAKQLMAETLESRLEPILLPPPRLPEEGVAPQDPTDCGDTLHVLVDGGRGHGAINAGQEVTPLPAEDRETASASAATDGSLRDGFPGEERRRPGGEKAPETCGTGRSESEVIAVGRPEDLKPEECAMLSAPMDEKPGGTETDMAEGNSATDEVNKEAGPGPLNMDLHLNPLEAIHLELDSMNAEADRALLQVERRFGPIHEYYLERRNDMIRNIPGFWVTAFRNHPQLSAMIRGQDAEMLSYLTDLEVKELRHPRTGCKFKFFFRRNPYFRNKLIVKAYEVISYGQVVSFSTLVMWRRGHGPQSFIHRNRHVICTFFTWFSDHCLPESDRIAHIIKEDIWPNPLQYYLLREGAHRARRRLVREPVEIPRPFGFQSG